MSLLQLWETSPEQIREKRLHQLIAFAGEGKLRDGSDTSQEFRAFLARVPSVMLISFVDEFLNASFPDSGFSLQDRPNAMMAVATGTSASNETARSFGSSDARVRAVKQ